MEFEGLGCQQKHVYALLMTRNNQVGLPCLVYKAPLIEGDQVLCPCKNTSSTCPSLALVGGKSAAFLLTL